MDFYRPKGQVLLITVLVLTIAITVALSLIGRSTSDARLTGQMEESARAFSAAEAGIEDVLKRMSGITATIQGENGDATFTTMYSTVAGTSDTFIYPGITKHGDAATIWLVEHTVDDVLSESVTGNHYCKNVGACTIDVCWEDNNAAQAALEIMVLYKNTTTATYDIQRFAYDPDTTRSGNKFINTGIATTGCGKTQHVHQVRVSLPITNALPLMLRLRPYYADATFFVAPVDNRILPMQGIEVSSLGKTNSGISRKIVVKKQYEAPPTIADYVLFSNDTITHEEYAQ